MSDEEGAVQRLGSIYVLEERIGSGGMGTVWRGRNTETGEAVAVKMLADNLSQDRDLVARFLQERAALTGVHHPNLVQVRDLVAERDRLGLVMDLVQGVDAGRALEHSGPLPAVVVARIGYEVCQALAAIHAAGIVHRDLKPANILRDGQTGTARLADFGIALLAGSTRLTAVNSVVGTPRYLAPELLTGADAGPPADVYALGICVYELLTGNVPFNGEHYAQILQQHLSAEPQPHPAIPQAVWPLIQRTLSKNPAERPDTVTLGGWFFSLLSEFGGAGTVGPAIWPTAAVVPAQSASNAPVLYSPPGAPGSNTPIPAPSNTMMMGYTARSAGTTPVPSGTSAGLAQPADWNNSPPPFPVPQQSGQSSYPPGPQQIGQSSYPPGPPAGQSSYPPGPQQIGQSSYPPGPPVGQSLDYSQGPFSAMTLPPKRRSGRKAWIAVGAVVAVAAAGAGVFLATGGGSGKPTATGTSTATSIATSTGGAVTPVTGSLVDRWAMAGTAHDSVGGKNGNSSKVNYTVASNGTGSAIFLGQTGQEIVVPSTVFNTERSFSIGVWVIRDGGTATGSGWQTVMAQRGKTVEGAALEYNPTANRWAFDMAEGDSSTAAVDSVLSKAAPSEKSWYHLIATYDGTTHVMSLYVNGVLQGTSVHNTDWSASGKFSIGSGLAAGVPSNWLHGSLSDVEVWNTALDPSGVKALH